jgi:hypothetical protein
MCASGEKKLNSEPAELCTALPLRHDSEFESDVICDAVPKLQCSDQPVDAYACEERVVSVNRYLVQATLLGTQVAALPQVFTPYLVGFR